MNLLNRFIFNDELQLGFTAGKGYQKALLMFGSVIDYFNDRGSNINVAGLDVVKAFNSVNHYGILLS